MNIGILGGSFDPVHSGHIHIAQEVLKNNKDINQVWLVPALRNPFKSEAETSYHHRLSMCRLAVNNITNVYASNAEEEIAQKLHKINLFTSDVLDNLPKDNKYYFIVGADCIERFYMWHNYKDILDNHGLIVLNRPGYILDEKNKKVTMVLEHPNVILINDKNPVDISSSEIRDAITSGTHITQLPENISNYITHHHLYV